MGLLDRFKKKPEMVAEPVVEAPAKKARKPRAKKAEPVVEKAKPNAKKKKTETEKPNPAKVEADAKGEPWVQVLSVELDPENIGNGAFELDWNDKFVTNLVRAGYQLKPGEADSVIVDRWFQDVCKNIAAENYEQWEANQPYEARPRVMDRRDLGDGKTEVS
jgi:hypothetical protein